MNHYKDSSKSSILKEGLTIQGTLSYMNVRTKSRSKNSSIAFFDIGEKQPVAYNLKHWFRHHPCCLRKTLTYQVRCLKNIKAHAFGNLNQLLI